MDITLPAKREAAGDGRHQIEQYLEAYPEIGPEERAQLLHLVRKAPAFDVAMLTTDEEMRRKLDRFRADHPSQFGIGPRQIVVAALIVAALVLLGALLWDAGLS